MKVKEFIVIEILMIMFALFWMFINRVRIELLPMYLIGGTVAVLISMFVANLIFELVFKDL